MEDIKEMFDQVNLNKWYKAIEKHTFRTEWLNMSPQECDVLLKYN